MSNSSRSRRGEPGASTTTPAGADAAALAADTPVIVGGGLTDPRAGAGATTSPGSTSAHIGRGWKFEPRPEPPGVVRLPQKFRGLAHWLFEHDAIEVLVFAGGAELVVGECRIELDPGRWIVARVDAGTVGLPPNTPYRCEPEVRVQLREG